MLVFQKKENGINYTITRDIYGTKKWWVNGKLHRESGPAIEYANGRKEWRLDGIGYSEKEFDKKIKGLKDSSK